MGEIEAINAQLERVTVRRKGGKLYLRFTAPPKPGDGDRPKRYDFSTGYSANPAGLKLAKARALEIEGLLIREKFSWQPYLKGKQKPPETVSEWLPKLEADYWSSRTKTLGRQETWYWDYEVPFARLPDEPVTFALLKAEILKAPPESKSRHRLSRAYSYLAKFAGLSEAEVKELRSLGAGYSPKVERILPPDEEIEQWRSRIKNPAYLWVYGMLATYGIRPHEIFHLDMSRVKKEGILRVKAQTKTGERLVWPCPSRWVGEWELWNVAMPNVNPEGKSNKTLGGRISQWFYENEIPFTPYYLRDAYAVRCSVLGIADSIAARWMGHSLDVHYRHYHKYITEGHNQLAHELMKRRERELLEGR